MYKIIVLIGKSASGKDSIIQKLHADFKIPIIISHTTRPKRESELDGCEYWFVSDDYFEQEKENFIEQRLYKTKGKDGSVQIWRYGVHEKDVKEGTNLVILDPQGLEEFKKYFGKENIFTFYIHANDCTRLNRLIERGDMNNPLEVARRMDSDEEDFKDFIESRNYYKVCNEYSIDSAVDEIEGVLKRRGLL